VPGCGTGLEATVLMRGRGACGNSRNEGVPPRGGFETAADFLAQEPKGNKPGIIIVIQEMGAGGDI
jgi:hypothetical protein